MRHVNPASEIDADIVVECLEAQAIADDVAVMTRDPIELIYP
jgi:hypothetical protein